MSPPLAPVLPEDLPSPRLDRAAIEQIVASGRRLLVQGGMGIHASDSVSGLVAAHRGARLVGVATISAVLKTPPSVRGWGRPGITGVTSSEMEAAALLGLDLKLLALAEPGPDGAVAASVLPTAVPDSGALGVTDGVINRVEILADPVGDVAFSGPMSSVIRWRT